MYSEPRLRMGIERGGGEARLDSPVQQKINEAYGVIEHLEKQVQLCYDQLQPVLRPEPPAPTTTGPGRDVVGGTPPAGPHSPTTESIDAIVRRVAMVCNQLEYIRQHLEV
jgi:hypothetical protein